MIKVCYIPHGRDYYKIREISKSLDDIEFAFVMKHKGAFEEAKREGFESYYMGDVFEQKSQFTQRELLDLDLKYGPYGIRAISNADLYMPYLYKNQEQRDQLVARAYKFWEGFFSRHKFDYILVNDTGSIDTRSAYNVVRTRKNPPIGRITLGPKHDSVTICDVGEEIYWRELDDILRGGVRALNDSQKKLVYDFIKVRGKQKQEIAKFNVIYDFTHRLKKFFSLAREIVRAKLKNDPADYASARYSLSKLIRKTWWVYFTRNLLRYSKGKDGERFVYFPLFYKYEIMKKALHHYWTKNQLALVREISESLPVGIKLYVKEHPGAQGNSSIRFLRKVQGISNVRLVNPYITGQELIGKCEAVVNLDGTSGWEAYLRRKPVVNITPLIYFAKSNLIYKVGSPCELPVTLFRAIQKGSSIYDENEIEWLWFIHSVISTCGEGVYVGNFDSISENYRKMAKYAGDKIRRTIARNEL